MKRFLYSLLLIFFMGVLPVFAIEADDSVDAIIKKTYNAEGSSLPKLPKTSPKSIESQNFLDSNNSENVEDYDKKLNAKKSNIQEKTVEVSKIPQKYNVAKVHRGQKINVKFNTAVSERAQKGSKISFISQVPVYSKHITLPKGTVLYGTVVNSHSPQIFGNGGLVSVKVDSIVYQGRSAYCEGNITNLNHNLILFNNIKGNNGYIKGIKKVTKPARTFYGKSLKTTKKLVNGIGIVLTPFTYLPGAVFLVCDCAAAPFIALFHKGDRVYIKNGTPAVIKLTSPVYIEY